MSIDATALITNEVKSLDAGSIRCMFLAGALLDGQKNDALKLSTGDENADGFYTNQEMCFLSDDGLQITEKARQIGQSWAFAVDSLARACTQPSTVSAHISTDQWESESKHGYIARTLDALPNAYKAKIKVKSNSKRHIEIETSRGVAAIDFLAQRAPRGAERTSVYLHEMAFMPKLADILKSSKYSLARGGFVKGCSTHEGSDSHFNEIVTNLATENGQQPHKAWSVGISLGGLARRSAST